MTTLAELVAATPAYDRGVVTQLVAGTGVWRWVIELADPSAGSSVVWYDVTDLVVGVELVRGSDTYAGRYKASTVELEFEVDDDSLATWNDDTSATFGTHVELGPGLLVRGGMIRVDGTTVAEWLPRFTARVEQWRGASFARGQIRQHRVTARDLLVELHGVPVANDLECNWSDRVTHVLTEAGWSFGSTVYGAILQSDTSDVLTLPDRDEQVSASIELDATLDPAGAVWYTDRTGKLIVRPQHADTFHAGMFTAGASGTAWTDPAAVTFHYDAELGAGAAYELDDTAGTSFDIDTTELSVVNRVVITGPGGVYDIDDPTSVQRFGPRPMSATWQADNDDVADDVLDRLAYAYREATPLETSIDQAGVFPAVARLDWLYPVTIVHRTAPGRSIVTADGVVRQIVERIAPRGTASIDWRFTIVADLDAVDVDTDLLPVTSLAASGVTDTEVLLSWTNPGGQPVAPTETWVRFPAQSSIWLELDYPITSLAWLGLSPATGYTADVRLVRRVDGLVTHSSPIRSVSFTTDDPPGAVVAPDGGVTMPDVGECVVEWELQQSDDGTTWTTVESGTAASGALVDLDAGTFVDGYSYRIETTEVCDGTPGTTYYSEVFVPTCATPPEYANNDAPFDRSDLIAFVPEICTPDTVVEAVSGNAGTHGPAWGGPLSIDVDELAMASDSGDGGIIAYGVTPNLIGTGDITIACRASVQTAETVTLWAVAGIRIDAVAGSGDWYPRATATLEGGEQVSVTDATARALITPAELAATYDQDTGVLTLYVNGTSVGTDAASLPGTARSGLQGGAWYVGAPAASWITNCGAWSSVLSTLPGVVPPPAFADVISNFFHAYWAEGDEFVALGLSNGDPVSTFPDEVGVSNLTGSGGDRPTLTSSVSGLNSKPALTFSGSQWLGGVMSVTFQNAAAAAGEWWEIIIGQYTDVGAPLGYLSDGNASTGRVIVAGNGMFAGTSLSGVTADTDPHGWAAKFAGASSAYILDGVTELTGNTGSAIRGGITVGDHWQRAGSVAPFDGHIAFYGFWAGNDITAESWWSDFVAAANAHYGGVLFS